MTHACGTVKCHQKQTQLLTAYDFDSVYYTSVCIVLIMAKTAPVSEALLTKHAILPDALQAQRCTYMLFM